MNPILFAIFVVVLFMFIYKNYFKTKRHENYPPGPREWPIWGGYAQVLLEDYQLPHRAIHNMAKRYNTKVLGTTFGSFNTVIACDFETVREVLNKPELQGRLDAFVPRYRGDGERLGIIFSEGDLWFEQRRFMLRNLRDFGFGRRSDDFESKVDDVLKELLEILRTGNKPFCKDGLIRFPDGFYGSSANMGIQIMFGDRKPYEQAHELSDVLMQQNKKFESTTGALNITPWTRFFAPTTVGYTITKYATKYSKDFVQKYIDDHKAHLSDDTTNDFTDRYLQAMKHDNSYSFLSEDQLRVTGMDMLFAASTTVPIMTSFIMHLLAKHPRVQKKCQEEIDNIVGHNKPPTLNDRPNMPFTEASIREGFRCQTLVPLGVPHKAIVDTTLGGYFVPKGAMVLTSLYSAHLDESIFDNPEEYRPERFLDEKGNIVKRDLSTPFGIGKRVCAGETFARQNIFLTVTTLLQSFNFTEDPSNPLPSFDENISGISQSPKPFWLKYEPRF